MPIDDATAKEIYRAMRWAVRHAENGHTPDWQEHGNSFAQDEARRCALEIANISVQQVSSEPFDTENPIDYAELRDFYISRNGMKE